MKIWMTIPDKTKNPSLSLSFLWWYPERGWHLKKGKNKVTNPKVSLDSLSQRWEFNNGNLTPQGVSHSWTLVAVDLSFSTATSCCEIFHRLTTMWRNTLWFWLFNWLETLLFLFWKQRRELSSSPTCFSCILRLERLFEPLLEDRHSISLIILTLL